MPHVILEYSSNIKEKGGFAPLFSKIHKILVETARAGIEGCQSRAVRCDHYFVGDGAAKNGFVHVQIYLMQGRTLEVRQEVGRKVLELLKDFFSKSLQELNLQISVLPKEIPKELYFKIP